MSLETKISSFEKALYRLKDAIEQYKQDPFNDVIRDGVIQRFEFTYELAWKTAKAYLESIGIVGRNSPKAVIWYFPLVTDKLPNYLIIPPDICPLILFPIKNPALEITQGVIAHS